MYTPNSLPVTGVGGATAVGLVAGAVLPTVWAILIAATLITALLVLWSFAKLRRGESLLGR